MKEHPPIAGIIVFKVEKISQLDIKKLLKNISTIKCNAIIMIFSRLQMEVITHILYYPRYYYISDYSVENGRNTKVSPKF